MGAIESTTMCDGVQGHVLQMRSNLSEDVVHHSSRQLAGVRVLAARMVGADEPAVRQRADTGVGKCRPRTDHDAATLHELQVRIEGNSSKRDDDAQVGKGVDLG